MYKPAGFRSNAELEARLSRLESDLYMARLSIIRLAPDKFRDLLESYRTCSSRAETYHWMDLVAEKIADQAEPIPGGVHSDYFGERGYCPLCREGAQSFYSHDAGFKLPEGLRRHLVGFGRSNLCVVMEAAKEMARDAWEGQFSATEKVEAVEKEVARKKRLATETLYVTGPSGEAQLAEDSVWKKARIDNDEPFGMKWAEQRLFSLAFQIAVVDRQKSYTKVFKHEDASFIVYADPRSQGSILFRVFDGEAKGKKRGLQIHSFDIRDSWKNQLAEKLARGVNDGIRRKIE